MSSGERLVCGHNPTSRGAGVIIASPERVVRNRFSRPEGQRPLLTAFPASVYTGDNDVSMEGYHADLAAKNRAAAERPWLPVEADEAPTDGVRAFWVADEAVKQDWRSIALLG